MSSQKDIWTEHREGLALIEHACATAPAVYAPARQRALFAQYYRTIGVLIAHGRAEEARAIFAQAMRLDSGLALRIVTEMKALQREPAYASRRP
jgi:hypothetical protein